MLVANDHKNVGKTNRGKAEKNKISWMNNFSTQSSKDQESSQMKRGDDLTGNGTPVIREELDSSLKGPLQVRGHEVPVHPKVGPQSVQKSHKVHSGADPQASKKRHESRDAKSQNPSKKRSTSFSDQVHVERDFLRVRKGVIKENADENLSSIEFGSSEKTPEHILKLLGKVDVDQNGRKYRSKFSIGFTSINVSDSYSSFKKCSKVILPDPPKSGILYNLNKQTRNEAIEKTPSDIPVEKALDHAEPLNESDSELKQTVSEGVQRKTSHPKTSDVQVLGSEDALDLTSRQAQQSNQKVEPATLAKDQAAQLRQPATAPVNHPPRGYYVQSPYIQPMGGGVIIQTSSIVEQQRFQKHQSPTIASSPQDPMFLHSLSRMQHHTSYVDSEDQHLYYQHRYPGYITHRDAGNIMVSGKKRDQSSLLRMNGRISPARIIHPETMELLVTPIPEEARVNTPPKGKSILATHESKPILIRHPDTKEEINISDLVQRNMKSAISAQNAETSSQTTQPATAPPAAAPPATAPPATAPPATAPPATAPPAAAPPATVPSITEPVEITKVPGSAAGLAVSVEPAMPAKSTVEPTALHERKDAHPTKQKLEVKPSKEVKPVKEVAAKSKEVKSSKEVKLGKEVAVRSKGPSKVDKIAEPAKPFKDVKGTKHANDGVKAVDAESEPSSESSIIGNDISETKTGDENAEKIKLEKTEEVPSQARKEPAGGASDGIQSTSPPKTVKRVERPVLKDESKTDSQISSSRSGSRTFSMSSGTVNEVIQMFESKTQESEAFAKKSITPGSDKKVPKPAKSVTDVPKLPEKEPSEPQKEAAPKILKSEAKPDTFKARDTPRKDIPTMKIVADIPRRRAFPENEDLERKDVREKIRITDFSQLRYPPEVTPPRRIDGEYLYSIEFFNAIRDACDNVGSSLDMTCTNCGASRSSPHTNLQCLLNRVRGSGEGHFRTQKYSHGSHAGGSMGGSGRHSRNDQHVQVYGYPRTGRGRDSHSQMGADRIRRDSEVVLNQVENAWKPHYQNQFRDSSNRIDSTEYTMNKIRGLLNKVTMVNIDYVAQSIYQLGDVTSESYLRILVDMIFEKTLSEPAFCFIYAKLCLKLSDMFASVANQSSNKDKEKPAALRKLILERCQQEFQKTSRWAVESKIVSNEIKEARSKIDSLTADAKQKLAEREYEQLVIKGRSLGNVKFVGELYKNNLIAEKVMYGCISHLLKYEEDPQEEKIESLFQLLSTIGGLLEKNGPSKELDKSFTQIKALLDCKKLCQRIKFMLMDVIDLRANNWVSKKVEVKESKPEMREQSGYYHHHDSDGQSNRFGQRDRPMGRSSHNQYHMGMRDMSKPRGNVQPSTRSVLETGDYGKFTLDSQKHKISDDFHFWPEICGKERHNNFRKSPGGQGMQSRVEKSSRPESKRENEFMYNHLSKDDLPEEKEVGMDEYTKKRDHASERTLELARIKAEKIVNDWIECKTEKSIVDGFKEELAVTGGTISSSDLQMMFLPMFMRTLLDLKMEDIYKGLDDVLLLYMNKHTTNRFHYINAIYGILDDFDYLCSDLPALPGIIGTFIGKCLKSGIFSNLDFEKTKEKYENIFKDKLYKSKLEEGIAQAGIAQSSARA